MSTIESPESDLILLVYNMSTGFYKPAQVFVVAGGIAWHNLDFLIESIGFFGPRLV